MGIEPTAQAWEAWVLPLYDARLSTKSKPVGPGSPVKLAETATGPKSGKRVFTTRLPAAFASEP
jgi:hypothetical protein